MSEAAAHFAAGRHAQAAELARGLCLRHEGFGPAHKLLGSALHLLGEHGEAARVLRLAAALLPRDGQTWSNLGNALSAAGEQAEAIAAHRQAVEPAAGRGDAALQPGLRAAGAGRACRSAGAVLAGL
ncbi:BTAD domain-containing putative transcriptional regulator [Thauera sp.]|uniref:BTAD domain-containing putative transcriptional regulator n=1 Tax=Thauera sp. TaxID=1905334 RepID=UPI0039E6C8D1